MQGSHRCQLGLAVMLGSCRGNFYQPCCSRSAETTMGSHHLLQCRLSHYCEEGLGDEGFGGVVGWPRSQLFWGRVGEGEALICSGFQGITGPALVGGAGGFQDFWVPTVIEAPLLSLTSQSLSLLWPCINLEKMGIHVASLPVGKPNYRQMCFL